MGYEYLDSPARSMKKRYPRYIEMIDQLVVDYKERLDAGLFKQAVSKRARGN